MQSVFGINLVALVDSQPRLLTLKQMIEAFMRHRREVVTRRTIFRPAQGEGSGPMCWKVSRLPSRTSIAS